MERYTAAGRVVLDDTAAHPDSLTATFDVAALLPHRRAVAVYAVRGSRGVDINAHNAAALARLASRHRIETLIVTASEEATAAEDAVTAGEIDATRRELEKGSRPFVVHATLRAAIAESLRRTGAGDLIVLVGAQGMNQGRSLLERAAG
jgi:UDP-N-acetylmuramoyl-L-alanyl-D-glutamate--2,6-diaminopimelate ligase